MSASTSRRLAALILRLGLGVLFIAHALAKVFLFTLPGTADFFSAVGFPGFLAYPVFAVELVAGVLLVAGLFTRWAALALVPVMAGATTVHWGNGWLFTNPDGGWEFTVFLGLAALTLYLLREDGALSVGERLARRPALGAAGRAA